MHSGGPVGLSAGSPDLLLFARCHLASLQLERASHPGGTPPTWEGGMGLQSGGKRGRSTCPCVAHTFLCTRMKFQTRTATHGDTKAQREVTRRS